MKYDPDRSRRQQPDPEAVALTLLELDDEDARLLERQVLAETSALSVLDADDVDEPEIERLIRKYDPNRDEDGAQ